MGTNTVNVTNWCQSLQLVEENLNTDYAVRNIPALVALIFGSLSILLNIRIYIEILTNRKKKEFSSTFFGVFIIASIVDSCWWVTNQLKDHVGVAPDLSFLIGWIPETSFILNIWSFTVHYFMLADILITVLVSTNRFLAIVFYHDDKIWKKIFLVGLLIVFLVPLAFVWQDLFELIAKCTINVSGNVYYIINPPIENYGIPYNLSVFIVSIGSAFINMIINAISVTSIIIQRKKTHSTTNVVKKVKGPEFKLFLLSVMICFNQSMLSGVHLSMFLQNYNILPIPTVIVRHLFDVSRIVIDIMCLSPSWLLIIMSKSIRSEVIPKYLNPFIKNGTSIGVVANQSQANNPFRKSPQFNFRA